MEKLWALQGRSEGRGRARIMALLLLAQDQALRRETVFPWSQDWSEADMAMNLATLGLSPVPGACFLPSWLQ